MLKEVKKCKRNSELSEPHQKRRNCLSVSWITPFNNLNVKQTSATSPMNKFNVAARLKSFKYAFAGIVYVLKTQHNFWIHISLGTFAIILGLFLNLTSTEWCLVIFAIGFVVVAEAFNTAFEALTDLVSPQYNEKAKVVKDVSAAAVLLSTITSFTVGSIVFLPKAWSWVAMTF